MVVSGATEFLDGVDGICVVDGLVENKEILLCYGKVAGLKLALGDGVPTIKELVGGGTTVDMLGVEDVSSQLVAKLGSYDGEDETSHFHRGESFALGDSRAEDGAIELIGVELLAGRAEVGAKHTRPDDCIELLLAGGVVVTELHVGVDVVDLLLEADARADSRDSAQHFHELDNGTAEEFLAILGGRLQEVGVSALDVCRGE